MTGPVGADVARLIALFDSPDYDTGGPLPPEQQADDDSGVWCIWEGGPLAHHARASAARCERWWRENRKTETDKDGND